MAVTSENPEGGDANVRPLFSAKQPRDPQELSARYVGLIEAAVDVLNARLLALLAVLGAIAIFALAAYDPVPWRLYAGAVYSAGIVWPLVWLYLRKG